jgi:hypothetical protein
MNSNPYEAPTQLRGESVQPQVESANGANSETARAGCLACGVGALLVAGVCLLQYMGLDVFVVRFRPYPAEANDYDWLIVLFPVVPALTLAALSSTRILPLDLVLGLISWITGLILAVPLVLTVGIWFHFAIGGSL